MKHTQKEWERAADAYLAAREKERRAERIYTSRRRDDGIITWGPRGSDAALKRWKSRRAITHKAWRRLVAVAGAIAGPEGDMYPRGYWTAERLARHN